MSEIGTVTSEAESYEAALSARRRLRIRRPRFLPSAAMPSDERPPRWIPLVLVGIAVGFNLWVLRAEVLPVRNLNDNSVHQSMVQWASDRIQGGHLPLDGWYPYLGLGSSLFHHYQSLPHTLTAMLGLAIGQDRAFFGSLYALLATWPISVYFGARLLGWDRWTAAGAALISPLIVSIPGYGYEHGSYTWRGLGVWSQLWAMWLLPLSWGLSWRAITGRSRTLAIAALFVGLTAACHFITGFLALLILPIFVLVKPSEFLRRLGRAAVVGIGGLLIISWVVVPLLLDARFSTVSRYSVGTFWFDSFGGRQVFDWLVSGKLFDGVVPERLPVVSVLVGIGAVVSLARFRVDERSRALLGALLLGLVLFSGRSPFGPVISLIPGNDDLLLHRFINCVHLAGVLLAGVGFGWCAAIVGRSVQVSKRTPRGVGVALAALAAIVLVLSPAWRERAAFDAQGAEWLRTQRDADATEGVNVDALIAQAKELGPGRIFAGASGTSAPDRIYSVPLYHYVLIDQADGVGFYLRTTGISTDVEVLFDQSNAALFDLFAIRYVIMPKEQDPLVPATLVDTKGLHSLYQVQTGGYLGVVDVLPPITADRTNLAERVEPFLRSALVSQGRFPAIDFSGGPPLAAVTLPATNRDSALPGSVASEIASIEDGVVVGEVDMDRAGMVLLKASFDPRWTVEVDGREVPTQMIAPSFVGREVAAGHHSIAFRYRPFSRYDALLAFGAVVFAVLQWAGAVVRRLAPPRGQVDPLATPSFVGGPRPRRFR